MCERCNIKGAIQESKSAINVLVVFNSLSAAQRTDEEYRLSNQIIISDSRASGKTFSNQNTQMKWLTADCPLYYGSSPFTTFMNTSVSYAAT